MLAAYRQGLAKSGLAALTYRVLVNHAALALSAAVLPAQPGSLTGVTGVPEDPGLLQSPECAGRAAGLSFGQAVASASRTAAGRQLTSRWAAASWSRRAAG